MADDLKPNPIPTTCHHPRCGRAIVFEGFSYWHADRQMHGHVVDLGTEYKAAQKILGEKILARARARNGR